MEKENKMKEDKNKSKKYPPQTGVKKSGQSHPANKGNNKNKTNNSAGDKSQASDRPPRKTAKQRRAEAKVVYESSASNRQPKKQSFAEYVESQKKNKQQPQSRKLLAVRNDVEDEVKELLGADEQTKQESRSKTPVHKRASKAQKAAREQSRKNTSQNDRETERKQAEKTEKTVKKTTENGKKLKIMFLGGVGEIGKNMTAFEYGNDIVIVDAGMSFPTAEMPGVDIVIPDITYLKENQSKIRGLLLTHGHEDHIGGVPYLLKELDIPVYGSRLTLALVENKLVEHEIFNYRLHLVDESSQVQLGVFKAEFVHVCHSIADSMAIALKTPVGTVFLTGDFKIDYTPIGGQVMNIHRIAELGKNGVTVLMAESTNVERAGYTMSEVVVTDTLRKVFNSNVGRRLIIATFASNVDRVQQIIDISKECGRKVAFGGRSMSKVVDTAKKAGVLNFDERDVVDIEKVNNVPDGEICILSTGTQGEPMSALTRMASGQFNKINIGKNDTIVISASPIPGNEKDVYKVINNLYRLGATVIYSSLADVHVSGHACREELKLMHSLLKPKFFIPIHGEYRHLCQHARLAESLGMDENNIVIPEIGSVIEVTNRKIAKKDQIPSGIVLVDGLTVGDVGKDLLKDRRTLAEEGIVLVLVGVDTTQGIVTSGPEIISRGCIYTGDDSNSRTVEDLKNLANTALQEIDLKELNVTITKQLIQKPIKSYFRKKYDRYPMIIPIILEN